MTDDELDPLFEELRARLIQRIAEGLDVDPVFLLRDTAWKLQRDADAKMGALLERAQRATEAVRDGD